MLEKEIISSISKRLAILQLTGDVVWWGRLNSGKVKDVFSGGYVQLMPKGTPDFISIVRNKQKGLDLVFIEAKRPGIDLKLRPDQLAFKNKYKDVDNVHVLVCDHPDYVNFYINDIAFDQIQEIKL